MKKILYNCSFVFLIRYEKHIIEKERKKIILIFNLT